MQFIILQIMLNKAKLLYLKIIAFWREMLVVLETDIDKLHTFAAGPVAQWITRLTTDQKIPGSNPGKVELLMIF